MSLKVLKDALAEVQRDEFSNGDVLRWTAHDKYTYAAIKTAIGWCTTARTAAGNVSQVVDFAGLIEVLSRPEVTDVQFALKWAGIENAQYEIEAEAAYRSAVARRAREDEDLGPCPAE